MKKAITFIGLVIFLSQVNAQSIENEIKSISGKFAGEWVTYKIGASGEIVKSMAWKDTLTATVPVINDSVAYVNIKSVMTFDNTKIPPYKMDFKEGFRIKNGLIQQHFFTAMGVESIETKIDNETYIISQPVSAYELGQLGVKNIIEATHTLVKVVFITNGSELQKISRVTTLLWKENEQVLSKQFVSMEGFHKRLAE